MHNIECKQGQWLGDIVIKETGDISALFEFAVKNDLSPTETLTIGKQLTPSTVINKRVINYLDRNNVEPASSDKGSARVVGRGIGNMTINVDFIVS